MRYRLDERDALEKKATRALANFGDQEAMRTELAEAVRRILETVQAGPRDPLTGGEQARIVRLARAVRARTAVERDGYRRDWR